MGYTKRQFCEAAHAELGLASYAFDMPTEQMQLSMRRLDAMMAEWNGRGLRLGYPMPSSPEGGDLDAETEVPDLAWEAVTLNLAIRVAPGFGKQPMPETKVAAKRALNTVFSAFAQPMEMQLPGTMPAGAGNKPWRNEDAFLPGATDPLLAGQDGPLEFD